MKKIDNKKVYMIFGIVMLIIAIAGSAYAYYSATASVKISGTAGGGNLTINVKRVSTSANDSLIPLDNDITTLNKAILGEGNTSNSFDSTKSCIDKNGLTACQVYKIIISNNSSVSISLNGGVSLKGSDTPNIECAVMDNDSSISNNKSCKGSKTLANKYSLNANTTKEYYILVYIKNINGVQTDTGNFTGTITFTSSDGNEVKARFNDDPALTTLTNLGLEVDTSHTPDFTTVSGNSGVKMDAQGGNTLATGLGDNTNGIYEAEDDLGTSYYFRGNVDNNFVYFANLWWRIIRINGDGTIRMIYAPSTSDYREHLAKPKFNSSYNDNAYVGYMYGTVGSSTYNDTHKNTNNSTIKGVIDEWYQNNLSDYSQYIADAIYCNDREVINNFNLTVGEQTMSFTGNGSGTTQTAYASLKRNFADHNPTLKCTNKNDRFTVSSSSGNGALTYPIGLITTDEVVMGGGNAYDVNTSSYIQNSNYYLFDNGGYYWTMTPGVFQANSDGAGGDAYVDDVIYGGFVKFDDVNNFGAARPVVTLVSNAISGGDGTSGNPFYVGSAPSTSYIPFVVESNPNSNPI